MLSSVLLHFGSPQQATELIEVGVRLARGASARVRGLTLADTRRMATTSATYESAVYAHNECGRLRRIEEAQAEVRTKLSQACLTAGIDFEVRRASGNPFEVLPHEAQFHDLVITSLPGPDATPSEASVLSAGELIELLLQGVQPLLVVRRPQQSFNRILLATDGSSASAAAIRQFVGQKLFPDAELRLLAIGHSESFARSVLREIADYCRGHRLNFESGWICGQPRRLLVAYAQKWSADLVVWGVPRSNPVVRRLLGGPAESVLRSTNMALYAVT